MDECMLNDLLECSVCLERLDTSSKVLPCQHTFCRKCLEEIVSARHELRCPECRILVDSKIEELPPNVLLMRILEGMKNATPKSLKTPTRGIGTPQRLFGGHQVAPVPSLTTQLAPVVLADPNRRLTSTSKQIYPPNQPYGRAIYDYASKVPGDLNFKKGDVILLRKKIDNNWYFGECGNSHGVFPLSYVQITTSLPPHVPQCKALYDFRMTNDDEDGCLTFNKGEIISVIRRVDENWAEGKLLDRIGIFPLAFVELNNVARALMKLSTNVQPGPSRVAPPTPTNEETTPLIPTDHSQNIQTIGQSRPLIPLASTALPASVSDSSMVSSGGSSTTTTPNTPNSSNTSSGSSTAPSSPGSPAASATSPAIASATAARHSVKRHSFTSTNAVAISQASYSHSHSHPHSQHRHSAEILSPATADSTFEAASNGEASEATESFSVAQASSGDAAERSNIRHRRSGSSDLVLAPQNSQNHPPADSTTSTSHLPTAYVALYPYKPQKADELELRKGCIYMVTERCQDGWFKGTSNRTQKCGVFPGNYVALAKCQRGLCRGVSTGANATTLQHQQSAAGGGTQPPTEARSTTLFGKNKSTIALSNSPRSAFPPPELPPRTVSPSTWHSTDQSQLAQCQSPPRLPEQPALAASLSANRTLDSAITNATDVASPCKQIPLPTVANSLNVPRASTSITPAVSTNSPQAGATAITPSTETKRSPSNVARGSSNAATPSGSNATGSASSNSKSSLPEKKEKKEKGVSLMRRLTNIKKSKSPPPVATYSMDNPVFDDGSSITALNPVHTRSGSCPSQLLLQTQGQVQEATVSSSSKQHRAYPSTVQGIHSGAASQRIRHKERAPLPASFVQRSGEERGTDDLAAGNHHRKSNSLDTGMGKQTKQQTFSRDRERVSRFRCIVPYPPNSEFELELRIGDIIYVHKKREDGWYKGTQQRTGRTGLFPASFVEAF